MYLCINPNIAFMQLPAYHAGNIDMRQKHLKLFSKVFPKTIFLLLYNVLIFWNCKTRS